MLAADNHDAIQVRGARENNLAGVSLDIPKRRLTVFTGVSGSGKSSLVFDTIAAESQRLINETYAAFVQNFMPSLGRPDVDSLGNLSGFAGPYAMGYLKDLTGNFTAGLLLLAGCAIVGAIVVMSLRIDVRREQSSGDVVLAH